ARRRVAPSSALGGRARALSRRGRARAARRRRPRGGARAVDRQGSAAQARRRRPRRPSALPAALVRGGTLPPGARRPRAGRARPRRRRAPRRLRERRAAGARPARAGGRRMSPAAVSLRSERLTDRETAARARLAPIAAEFPFASRFFEHPPGTDAAGALQHFVDEGPREPRALVFVHGNPTWSFAFRRPLLAL